MLATNCAHEPVQLLDVLFAGMLSDSKEGHHEDA